MNWPSDETEFANAARETFIDAMISQAEYWAAFGEDLLTNPQPDEPYTRSWSEVAKKDHSYREVFSTLTLEQRTKVLELLKQCVSGAVFSSLCTIDQFPGGEAEVWIWDDVCGDGKRKVKIAPTETDLHDEYYARQSE